jgi:hypothetical protein
MNCSSRDRSQYAARTSLKLRSGTSLCRLAEHLRLVTVLREDAERLVDRARLR